ncbi:integrase catalytic domain-containing protein [Trichonephila clavipes]|uniref:Integrase catalytic domain-containing protein n=1 Tax=Trichonephila clavipes TaxID=2585209 RepID=A0A8X6V9G2_TRICX|nr:integrase catalytic domain-containing protein [Trichonephila clavipes]
MVSKAKILKSIQHFDNVGKEIERFEERIRDAIGQPDCSAALIDVLKSKIEKYEKKLEETFSELNLDVDNASQLSLISGRLKEKLDIPVKSENHKISGINGVNAETSLHSCTIEFTPHFSSLKFNLEAIVVNKVTSPLPNFQFENRQFPHLKNLKLADPNFHISKPIDVLLGAEIYADLLEGMPIFGPAGTPTAIPTKLRYILSGKIYAPPLKESIVNSSLNDQLSELWKLEEVPKTNAKIQILDPCEESFSKSVKRNNEGRYIVNLPFKENNTLGESKEKAVQLLYALENKFHKNKQFKDNFLNFMNEYLALGHMREISQKRDDETPNCYIPYHMVINEKSTTTKCRVVFNASSKTKNGKSLNDVLITGPKLQTEIFNHLIKFRSYRVAFAADIEKMYRQILILDEDCKYQRIVWRATPSDSLKSFELQTITYGTSCAPFLALRTLQQLYQDDEQNFPLAAKIARENIYIDNLLSGADTEVEAKSIIIEIQNLLKSGGFILRKWSSSHPKVLQDLDTSLLASKPLHSLGDEESKQRVLGLIWNLKTDSIQVKVVHEEIVKTKRQLLSVIAQIFDPLGLFSPSVITLKIMLQELWKSKALWDDPIPSSILENWNKFTKESKYLNSISIPRFLGIDQNSDIILHGFCDTSTKAYAAVVYLKSKQEIYIL